MTVVRLGDKFATLSQELIELNKRIEGFEKEVEGRLKENIEVLYDQLDRIIDLIKWAGILFIPIIFNTVSGILKSAKSE